MESFFIFSLIKLLCGTWQVIIGPATVGGIQAGAFKIGDTAGTLENIVESKLYRPGSVGFVSKSVWISSHAIVSWYGYSARNA